MPKYYTREKNAQIIISLLKMHGIRNVVASPGTTNVALIGSLQRDPFFNLYSSVDERSSAYLACGMAAETGEPVVISCTGATASRNYMPGLTEAYYRKLPVLAITSTQSIAKIGHHVAQVIDRSAHANDVVKRSFQLPIVTNAESFWECEVKVNQALYELAKGGGGPVHINLPTIYDPYFDVKHLPSVRCIKTFNRDSQLPKLEGRIAVFVGAHKRFSSRQHEALEAFSEKYGAAVFCDHTSGYKGKNRIQFALAAGQECFDSSKLRPAISIHIGEVSGDYHTLRAIGGEVWRISEDGEIRDTFRRMTCFFDMPEEVFFEAYAERAKTSSNFYNDCRDHLDKVRLSTPDLPFSNIWIAQQLSGKLPHGSVIHFGILNSLRSWNLFDLDQSIRSNSNTGGFGIDGGLSSLVGASLMNPDTLYFGVIGDLAFFYDLNVLGNRHVGNNLRILVVNNGKGTEFTNHGHHASRFGNLADDYMAAAGHFGNKSPRLIKSFVESLGFEYLSAGNKEEFAECYGSYISKDVKNKSLIFEVFTDSKDESLALKTVVSIDRSAKQRLKNKARTILKRREFGFVRKLLRK